MVQDTSLLLPHMALLLYSIGVQVSQGRLEWDCSRTACICGIQVVEGTTLIPSQVA